MGEEAPSTYDMSKPKKQRSQVRKLVKKNTKTSTQAAKTPTAKKSVVERILEFGQVGENLHASSVCHAILGDAGSIVDMSLANQAQMSGILSMAQESVCRYLGENELEWGVQRTRFGVVSGSSAEIDVPRIRKASRFYALAGVDAIVMVVPGPVPLESDRSGFGIALDAYTFVFGPDARSRIHRAEVKSRAHRTASHSRHPMRWYEASEQDALKTELTNMFRPSLIKVPTVDGDKESALPEDWNSRQSRQLRGYVTLMMRSMQPLKKSVVLIGEGRTLMVGAIAQAEENMKKARRGSEPAVHPDGLPHFWFQQLRRLGLDNISVPLIKLR